MMFKLKKEAIIVVAVIAIVVVLSLVAQFAPDKVFIPPDDASGGVRLLRDDFEINVFYTRGSWIEEGVHPYAQGRFQEYPQLGLAYITLPYLFSDSYVGYRIWLLIFNTLCFIALVIVSQKLLAKLGRSNLRLLLLLLPAVLYFSFNRFDIVVVLLVQLSLYFLISKKYLWAFGIIACAVLVKWYPLLLVPLYWYYMYNTVDNHQKKYVATKTIFVFVAPLIFVLGISFFIDGIHSFQPYAFHGSRPAGVGSLYHTLVQQLFPGTGESTDNAIGFNIFLLLQISVPLASFILPNYFKKRLQKPEQLIYWSVLAILCFFLFSRFFSPQWIVWLMPLLALVAKEWKEVLLVIVFDVFIFISFPVLWQTVGYTSPAFIAVTLAISGIMVVLLVMYTRRISSQPQYL